MGFSLKLYYAFSKRLNSTAQPVENTYTITTTCELKAPTSIFMPTMVLDNTTIPAPYKVTDYTYARVTDFQRYYYITNWTWTNGHWLIHMECDVLASFKSGIGSSTQYVLRSASQCDVDVIDTKYPTKSNIQYSVSSSSSPWQRNLDSTSVSSGFYVIGVVNNDTGSIGATSYYACCGAALRALMSQLYASPSWMNITDTSISTDLQKIMMNPIQYIISCMFIPSSLSTSGLTSTTVIPVGWWTFTVSTNYTFYKLKSTSMKTDFVLDLTIPVHSQATGNYKWLRNSPYSVYQMQFFPFGVFQLDSAKLYGYTGIRNTVTIDLITGIGTLLISRYITSGGSTTYYNETIYSSTSQVGIPISLAQMAVDMSKLGNSSTWLLAGGMALANLASEFGSSEVSTLAQGAAKVLTSSPSEAQRAARAAGISPLNYKATAEFIESYNGGSTTSVWDNTERFSMGSLISSIAQTAADVGNAALASSGVCTTQGQTGGIAQYSFSVELLLCASLIVAADPTHYGYPLCQSKQINTLSGFVLCANDGDLALYGATESERQAVIAFLTAGFYYE